jgi:pimeloyl-ACP methyl ester carboxylesterase
LKVALVGGFGAPPALLRPLRDALRADGFDVAIAPLGLNTDCGEKTVQRLELWLEEFGDSGPPLAIVGHSRGGQLGRVVAVRRPDLVACLITVVTPWALGPPDRPGVAAVTRVVRGARRLGVNVMGSIDCATGDCCVDYRRDVAAKPPARWTALWSSTDRVAGDDGRPPRATDNAVDIRTSHTGAVTSPAGKEAVLAELRG